MFSLKNMRPLLRQRRAAVIQNFSSKIRRGGIIQCHHRFNMGSWPAAIAGGQVSILYTTDASFPMNLILCLPGSSEANKCFLV